MRDADATLIFCWGEPQGGTLLTLECARAASRPHLLVDLAAAPDSAPVRAWLRETAPHTLNVAGPRESEAPGIGDAVRRLLGAVLATLDRPPAPRGSPQRRL